MSDEWLEQLQQLHQADKSRSQPEPIPPEQRLPEAAELMRQSKAHELIRQLQKVLLDGKGLVDIFDTTNKYERVISLVWQGPISDARKPDPDDPEPFYYIFVAVRAGKLWVNDKSLQGTTPQVLKTALLQAAKKPGRKKQKK